MPDARHLSLPHVGHWPQLENQSVRRGAADFLATQRVAALNAAASTPAPHLPCAGWVSPLLAAGLRGCRVVGPAQLWLRPRRRPMGCMAGRAMGLRPGAVCPGWGALLVDIATPGRCCQPLQPASRRLSQSLLPEVAEAACTTLLPRLPGCRARNAWPPVAGQWCLVTPGGAAVLAGCTDARRCCRQRPARLQSRCACWWWAPCMATNSPPHRWPCAGLAWRRPRGGGRAPGPSARALALHPVLNPMACWPQTHARVNAGGVEPEPQLPTPAGPEGSPRCTGKSAPWTRAAGQPHAAVRAGIALLHQQMDQFQPQLVSASTRLWRAGL